jgi:hypothetical protein
VKADDVRPLFGYVRVVARIPVCMELCVEDLRALALALEIAEFPPEAVELRDILREVLK